MLKAKRKGSEPILEKERPAGVPGRKWVEETGKEESRAENSQPRTHGLK